MWPKLRSLTPLISLAMAVVFLFSVTAYAKDPQLIPRRLASTGDSLSLGGDAEYYGPNINASWVSGYYGYWQMMQGFTNVYSHNQRITDIWGALGRKNFVGAAGGSTMANFPVQAWRAVNQQAQYVTVLMGHNDVCQEAPWMIPSDATYEANFRAGMTTLQNRLPAGATIFVVAIADLYHLWEVGKEKELLGIVNCSKIWSLERFICDTVLDPANTDADRAYSRSRNIAFNEILERVTAEYEANDPHHHYFFTNQLFYYPFVESEISDLDCFHPSAEGQVAVADLTWNNGPFKDYQP